MATSVAQFSILDGCLNGYQPRYSVHCDASAACFRRFVYRMNINFEF